MKVILIDPKKRELTEIEVAGFKDLYTLLDVQMIEFVYFPGTNYEETYDCIAVDEEGLINGNPHGWFSVVNGHQERYRGMGAILAVDMESGDSVGATRTLEFYRANITFPD